MPLSTLPAADARRALLRAVAVVALLIALMAAAPVAARAELGWQPTTDLAAPTDGAATQPALATDDDGAVYAAWVRASTSGGPSLIQVARKSPEGTWGAPVVVSRAVGAEAGSLVTEAPTVAVHDGVVAVGWLQTTPDSTRAASHEAWVATRTADGTWRAAERRSTAGSTAGHPTVAVAHDGAVTLGWTESLRSSGVGVLRVADMAAEGTWERPAAVAPTSATIFAGYTDLAVDDRGAATLVWQDAVADNPVVLAVRRAPGSLRWSAVETLSDPADYALYPELDLAADGSADVVWAARVDETSQFAHYEVQTARRAGATGAWSAVEILSQPGGEAHGRGTSKNPTIATDQAGNTTVAWLRSEGANADLRPDVAQVRTRRAGEATWGPVADVWSGLRNPTLRQTSLAVARDGQATVAVSGYTTGVNGASGPRNVRVVHRETLDGTWSPERQLSVARVGSSTAVSWQPAVVADALGNVTLAWHQTDATGEIGVQTSALRVAEPLPAPAAQPDTGAPAAAPSAPGAPAVAPAPAVTPAAVAPRPAAGWIAAQSRRYAAANGVRVSFRGTPGARASVVVRRGTRVVGRIRAARVSATGRLVARVRLSPAARRSLLRSAGPVVLRVTFTVDGRSAKASVRLR
ncbi:hypothetical protein [Patulibacter americanus]|uniref:hypothetical protein n=1 Tax=Patulibacter americanus TaxID=588672 RepID=UPI0003B755CA|nr:hypothetical protein [Patulibacter americanus]